MSTILIDTNVLVYAHDREEWDKQAQAIKVLQQIHLSARGRLSVQCLAEFFQAVTRGDRPKLSLKEAARQADNLSRAWPVLDITAQIVLEATRGVLEYQFNYWDAQIWATARLNQIPIILSEDFATGSTIEGVRFVNPFTPVLQLDDWFI
ncbi:MAG: PIN domain-containing protein [Chloroflexia bacterium]|nr:PIN domain-containing protein [Chloroflexia bacterium]